MISSKISTKKGEKTALRNEAIVASDTLSMENFQMVLFKTLKCVSKDKQDEQLNMVFDELKILTDTMWKVFSTKEYAIWTVNNNEASIYERRFSGFFINFAKEANKTGLCETEQYNEFMKENGINYFKLIKRFRYKFFNGRASKVGKQYRNSMKEIFLKYQDEEVVEQNVAKQVGNERVVNEQVAKKPKKRSGLKLLIGIILAPFVLFVAVITILVIARLFG